MIFSLPENYLASTTEMINILTTDLKGLIILALGLALAFYFLNKIIGLIRSTMKGK